MEHHEVNMRSALGISQILLSLPLTLLLLLLLL
jgi:hypothetical protein